MTNNLAQDTAAGAPPKRSLFKKPAWAKTQTSVDPVDFFSRSKEVYTDIIAEEDRERQKRIEKRVKADQKGCGPNAKRRRVNVEDEDSSSSAEDDDDDSGGDIPKPRSATEEANLPVIHCMIAYFYSAERQNLSHYQTQMTRTIDHHPHP
jgi:hypothetical protein